MHWDLLRKTFAQRTPMNDGTTLSSRGDGKGFRPQTFASEKTFYFPTDFRTSWIEWKRIHFHRHMNKIVLCSISREKVQSHVLNGSNVVTTCVSARSTGVQLFNDRGVKVFIPDTFLRSIALICSRRSQILDFTQNVGLYQNSSQGLGLSLFT